MDSYVATTSMRKRLISFKQKTNTGMFLVRENQIVLMQNVIVGPPIRNVVKNSDVAS